MTHYTRCLADQLRSYEITVNCIAPVDTRTGRFMGTRAVDQERMVETGTLDRIATVDEVARVVEVFAGPLGAFVSGQVLRVDGGGTVLGGVRRMPVCQPQTLLGFRHCLIGLDWTPASWAAQARRQPHRRCFQNGKGCCKLHM